MSPRACVRRFTQCFASGRSEGVGHGQERSCKHFRSGRGAISWMYTGGRAHPLHPPAILEVCYLRLQPTGGDSPYRRNATAVTVSAWAGELPAALTWEEGYRQMCEIHADREVPPMVELMRTVPDSGTRRSRYTDVAVHRPGLKPSELRESLVLMWTLMLREYDDFARRAREASAALMAELDSETSTRQEHEMRAQARRAKRQQQAQRRRQRGAAPAEDKPDSQGEDRPEVEPEDASEVKPEDASEDMTEGHGVAPISGTRSECVVCLDAEPGAVFTPCGHCAVCMGCMPAVRGAGRCPYCQAAITDVIVLGR